MVSGVESGVPPLEYVKASPILASTLFASPGTVAAAVPAQSEILFGAGPDPSLPTDREEPE
jgi:hypothetical protein